MTDVEKLSIDEVFDIPTLTARAAARWGARTALTFDETEERLSFNEVESESNKVANALIARGVNPGIE